jgi:hypothetical protein
MTNTDASTGAENPPQDNPRVRVRNHTVRLPGFLKPEAELGLGDAIKLATASVGVKPCAGCLGRAASLNRWMRFTGPRRGGM